MQIIKDILQYNKSKYLTHIAASTFFFSSSLNDRTLLRDITETYQEVNLVILAKDSLTDKEEYDRHQLE